MKGEWYYTRGGHRLGPVPEERIREIYQSGMLFDSDFVWAPGMTKWLPAAEVKGRILGVPEPPDTPSFAPIDLGLDSPFSTARPVVLASQVAHARLGERLLAGLLDWSMIVALVWAAARLLSPLADLGAEFPLDPTAPAEERQLYSRTMPGPPIVNCLAYYLLPVLYGTIFEATPLQATPGKRLLGLKVTDGTGNRISVLRALGRNVLELLLAAPCLMTYWLILTNSERRGLHDRLTGTRVVRR